MTSRYQQVVISAEDLRQADRILGCLLKKRLVIGGLMLKAPAKFWWKGKIIEMQYCNIVGYTFSKYKAAIKRAVREISVEEVPMIIFSAIEGNKEFFSWINEQIG